MRCVILLVALLAIMSSIPPVMAGKLTVNSTLIAQYWGRGHTFGSMDTQSFDAALIELASERYVHFHYPSSLLYHLSPLCSSLHIPSLN